MPKANLGMLAPEALGPYLPKRFTLNHELAALTIGELIAKATPEHGIGGRTFRDWACIPGVLGPDFQIIRDAIERWAATVKHKIHVTPVDRVWDEVIGKDREETK